MSDAYYNAEKWGFAPRPKPAVKTVCIPGPDGYSDAYNIGGIPAPTYPPVEDATGFPFDDNAPGEELDRVLMAEAISRKSSTMNENLCEYTSDPCLSPGQACRCTHCQSHAERYVNRQQPKAAQALGGHPDFYKILDEMKALYSAKHYQYATDADPMINFRSCGSLAAKLIKPGVNQTLAAALLLMSKQIVGVYEIVGEGKTNTIESLQDKLRDIGIYSVILQILVAETQK
jgi:hypothetical protein